MLEGGNVELTRMRIEKVIINQYERLQEEKLKAGAKALAITVKCTDDKRQLCNQSGHSAPQCRSSQISKGQQHSKFSRQCFTCGKRGHRAEECKGAKEGNVMGINGKPKTSYTSRYRRKLAAMPFRRWLITAPLKEENVSS